MIGRRPLFRWLGWFVVANAAIYLLVALRYLQGLPWSGTPLGLTYLPLAMVGHTTLLAALTLVPLSALLIAIRPLPRATRALTVFLAATGATLLVLDTNIYTEWKLHLSVLVAQLFVARTWIGVAMMFAVALLFEALLAGILWRSLANRPAAGGRRLGVALALVWFASQALHVWGDAIGDTAVTRLTSHLPLHYPRTAKRLLARLGLIDPTRVQQAILARRAAAADEGSELHYPLAPLDCTRPASKPQNVLWVVIDGLRPDAVDATPMPALATLRERSLVFENHWSGGTSSQAGAFAMFYGLPATYFQTFYDHQRAPVLLDRFRAAGYELAAMSATGFRSTTLSDRTVVVGIPTLVATDTLAVQQSNPAVTDAFERWIAARPADRPFLAILWYNPLNVPPGPATGVERDGRYAADARADELWNGYRGGLGLVDRDVARVSAALEAAGQDAQTLIIVAGDHGYEFNDLGLGDYGAASNFGAPQLRAPLYLRWPGRAPRAYSHRTAHQDLPATLLVELLGCRNPPADYGSGHSLFDGRSWEWMIAGNYNSYAIVESDRVIVTYRGGLTEVLGPDMRPAQDPTPDPALIAAAFAEMRRFRR
jgi:membrane-anchored protein YejM (alkaline phosphatase superfamily)